MQAIVSLLLRRIGIGQTTLRPMLALSALGSQLLHTDKPGDGHARGSGLGEGRACAPAERVCDSQSFELPAETVLRRADRLGRWHGAPSNPEAGQAGLARRRQASAQRRCGRGPRRGPRVVPVRAGRRQRPVPARGHWLDPPVDGGQGGTRALIHAGRGREK